MFIRTPVWSFSVTVILCISLRVKTSYVDKVVKRCRIEVRKFAASESKYAVRNEQHPQLFNLPFKEQIDQGGKIEKMQRNFECIADTLNIYSDEQLPPSRKYLSLVEECKASNPFNHLEKCCDASQPRTLNGTCNNLLHPSWGAVYTCFRRLWPANYEGVAGFRRSVETEEPLPNTRYISRELITPEIELENDINGLFAFFGQAVAHDIAQFPFTLVDDDKKLDCCYPPSEEDQHPQCAPIFIDSSDPFYSTKYVRCFSFDRVSPCDTCSVEKRFPLNVVTHWIDGSIVYGTSVSKSQELLSKDGTGTHISQYRGYEELLPPDESRGGTCGDPSKEEYCFSAGDSRANQQTPLAIFQTLLHREHNRIARKLKELNPDLDKDILFERSRTIVISEFQMIIYNEYLPILLGPRLMSKFGLWIGQGGGYDPTINPSLSVEFNAAAFRIHSMLPRKVVFREYIELLRYHYINTKPLYNDRTSAYVYKMANVAAEKYDHYMPQDVSTYLYRSLNGTYGFDLSAVDIQRGRDIGLPTYAQVIEYMEKRPDTINTFDDLEAYITPECINIFQNLYEHVRDIDLYAGMICEKIPGDMIISPTAAHIVAEQFGRLKYGDRFFFEHNNKFTDEQRQTLLKASLAKLICDNTKLENFQPMAFISQGDRNPPVPCSSIPGVELEEFMNY